MRHRERHREYIGLIICTVFWVSTCDCLCLAIYSDRHFFVLLLVITCLLADIPDYETRRTPPRVYWPVNLDGNLNFYFCISLLDGLYLKPSIISALGQTCLQIHLSMRQEERHREFAGQKISTVLWIFVYASHRLTAYLCVRVIIYTALSCLHFWSIVRPPLTDSPGHVTKRTPKRIHRPPDLHGTKCARTWRVMCLTVWLSLFLHSRSLTFDSFDHEPRANRTRCVWGNGNNAENGHA